MHALSAHDPAKLLDLLAARLAFERVAGGLYEAILGKLRAVEAPALDRLIAILQQQCDEEREHARWLEAQIAMLGGETRDGRAIDIVLANDQDPAQLFHALLAAELADTAGWDLLVQLADQAGDHDAKDALEMRLHQEQRHLALVRRIVTRLATRVIVDETLPAP